jgi:hypothetical protein
MICSLFLVLNLKLLATSQVQEPNYMAGFDSFSALDLKSI